MGWSSCGNDSQGRPIGYAHEAVCDENGCDKEIDRGLSYVCGNMHGECTWSCEKYFCENHRRLVVLPDGECESICRECHNELLYSLVTKGE